MKDNRTDKRVTALRIIGMATLAMGFIALATGAPHSTIACFCGAGTCINASNVINKKNKER